MVGWLVQRIAVESPGQIRQESRSDLINLETRARRTYLPTNLRTYPPIYPARPKFHPDRRHSRSRTLTNPRLIAFSLTTLSRLSNYLGIEFRRPRFFGPLARLPRYSPSVESIFLENRATRPTKITGRVGPCGSRDPAPTLEDDPFTGLKGEKREESRLRPLMYQICVLLEIKLPRGNILTRVSRAIRTDGEEKNSGKFKMNETPESS